MRSLNPIILLTTALFFCVGCIREVKDIALPEEKSQMVLFSFLFPEDTLITVQVYRSAPILNSPIQEDLFKPVTNAQVALSGSDGSTAILVYSDTLRLYIVAQPWSVFSIKPGITYTLNAEEGNNRIQGSCTVPLIGATIQSSSELAGSGSGNKDYRLKINWTNPGPGTHFYRHAFRYRYYINGMPGSDFNICDGVAMSEKGVGEILTTDCSYNLSNPFAADSSFFDYYLLTTDKPYYEYHIRRLEYVGDNPFVEPLQQYSNVQGGLGVVASYRQSIFSKSLL